NIIIRVVVHIYTALVLQAYSHTWMEDNNKITVTRICTHMYFNLMFYIINKTKQKLQKSVPLAQHRLLGSLNIVRKLALASKNHNAIVFTALPYVILNVPVPACMSSYRCMTSLSAKHYLSTETTARPIYAFQQYYPGNGSSCPKNMKNMYAFMPIILYSAKKFVLRRKNFLKNVLNSIEQLPAMCPNGLKLAVTTLACPLKDNNKRSLNERHPGSTPSHSIVQSDSVQRPKRQRHVAVPVELAPAAFPNSTGSKVPSALRPDPPRRKNSMPKLTQTSTASQTDNIGWSTAKPYTRKTAVGTQTVPVPHKSTAPQDVRRPIPVDKKVGTDVTCTCWRTPIAQMPTNNMHTRYNNRCCLRQQPYL
ncbi:hypothetical protein L9F63_021998, partial [Diploptera punctata]